VVEFSGVLFGDSNEALSRNVSLVEERMCYSLRDLLRAFTLNPAASDSVLRDDSLIQERSESANEIIRQLKVRFSSS